MTITAGPNFQAHKFLSDPLALSGTLVLIATPAHWQPAVLTFQISLDGGTTWLNVQGVNNAELSFTLDPGVAVHLQPGWFLDPATKICFRSGSSKNPVTQPQAVSFTCVTSP